MTRETDTLLTVRQAANVARRTTETVRRWIWDGKLPARKLGNQLFIRREDLDRICGNDREVVKAKQRAALDEARRVREAIYRRTGHHVDVQAAIEESRESHP
jgi:excisionase family DNA binding protein